MKNRGGYIDFNIRVWMTPADLRQIADEMEEVWGEMVVGDNLCVRDWHLDDRTTLTFAIDQERMPHG